MSKDKVKESQKLEFIQAFSRSQPLFDSTAAVNNNKSEPFQLHPDVSPISGRQDTVTHR